MSIALCTLVLNEIQWLDKLWNQHKDWPELSKWVFVESADRVYAETNPEMVTSNGLSVDGTSQFLQELEIKDERVRYIPFGFSTHTNPAQGKCESRQQYLNALEEVKPEYLIVCDGDEFWLRDDQQRILDLMRHYQGKDAFVFKHRDIWRPPVIDKLPLFSYEVTGGFWDIPYCRCWRWYPGLRYATNHNTPEKGGVGLDCRMKRFDGKVNAPAFIHMGFASSLKSRAAKHAYYKARGEGTTDHRGWYCDSRACFENWRPGDVLPRGAKVIEYNGKIPEAFIEGPCRFDHSEDDEDE